MRTLFNTLNLSKTKIRFNLMFTEKKGDNWNPIDIYLEDNMELLLEGHYWNYTNRKSYQEGQNTLGFLRIFSDIPDYWLLFHIGWVTRDLNIYNQMGYEFKTLDEYKQYPGRLIIRFHNRTQNMIRKAETVIDHCKVHKILKSDFDQTALNNLRSELLND